MSFEGHTPFRVFDDYLPDYQNVLEEIVEVLDKIEGTEKFNRVISDQSRGEGMMEDDVEFLSNFYKVPNPYE